MTPKNTGTKVGILLTLLLVVTFVVVGNLVLPSRLTPYNGGNATFGATVYPTRIEGIAESCGDMYQWQHLTSENYAYIPASYLQQRKTPQIPEFGTIIPVAGYMSQTALPRTAVHFYGFKDNPGYQTYQILRLMYDYHTTVIWYSHALSDTAVESIKRFTTTHHNVMALPWDKTQRRDRDIPENRNVAFSAWATSQSCLNWDITVMSQFLDFSKAHQVTHPVNAHVAKLNTRGVLPEINPAVLYEVRKAHQAVPSTH